MLLHRSRRRPSVATVLTELFRTARQRELLARQHWISSADLASAILEWISGPHSLRCRHAGQRMLNRTSPRPDTPPRQDHQPKLSRQPGQTPCS